MKLLKLYESLLGTAKRVVNEDGTVSQSFGGKSEPTLVKGKRLVIPTREHLSNPDWSNRVVFHPLSENILRGESSVLEDFRHALNVRTNWTIGLLAYQLLMIATSEDEHKKLSPDQTEYLSLVKNATEKSTLPAFKSLMKAMPLDQTQKAFVSIYLKRGGTVAGKRHTRVGIVSFPLYAELIKKDADVIWGVKVGKKNVEILKKLFEYMIPGIETPEAHNRGSDSEVAPYLDALMKATMAVAGPLNDLIELFSNILAVNSPDDDAHPDKLRFEDAWVETFDNLGVMIPEIRAIPMQAGNDGAPAKQPAAAAPLPAAVAALAQPASPLPAALSNPGWNQPQQPVSAFAAAAAAPGPVHTGRGLDFDSLLRSNAALAQQVGGVAAPQQNTGWGQPQQQNNTPSWARPSGGNPVWGGGGNQQQGGMPSWAQPNQGGGNNWGGQQSGPYNPSI